MAGRSLKEPSKFFANLAFGAVAARAVMHDLALRGHNVVQLERGSDDTKVWTGIKRKALRIPDILCLDCGLRVESRAKGKAEIAMSTSNNPLRVWDYGLADDDVVAFPVAVRDVSAVNTSSFSGEKARATWKERVDHVWHLSETISYFTVKALRDTAQQAKQSGRKDQSGGSEVALKWKMRASTVDGVVESIEDRKKDDGTPFKGIVIKPTDGSRRRSPSSYFVEAGDVTIGDVFVEEGGIVKKDQFVTGTVWPLGDLPCDGEPDSKIRNWLSSSFAADQYTALKLARHTKRTSIAENARLLASDARSDVYVRLEACAYLCQVLQHDAAETFEWALEGDSDETKLEAIIALSELCGSGAVRALEEFLDGGADFNPSLIAASIWSLAQIGGTREVDVLLAHASSESDEVRRGVIEGLRDIVEGNDEARHRLMNALFREAPECEVAVAALLSASTSEDITGALVQAIESNGGANSAVLRFLGLAVDVDRLATFRGVLTEPEMAAASALAALRSDRSFGPWLS